MRPPVSLATAKSGPRMPWARQLAFYLSGGILAPALIWSFVRGLPISEPIAQITLIQLVLANLACWHVLGRLRTYARSRLLSYVLPVIVSVFGVVFAANSFLRSGFSHSLFVTCAMATLFVAYLVTGYIRHANPKLRHFIIPGGNVSGLRGKQGFEIALGIVQLQQLVEADEISGSIIADLHYEHTAEWERLLARAALRGIPVYHYRLIEEALTGEVRIDHLRENDLGSLIPNLPYRAAKRTLDIIGVVLLAPIIAPWSVLLALFIKLDSEGPALFFQERIGFRGETFRMVKFRTMRIATTDQSLPEQREYAKTADNDPRITRIGRWLRRTRLDELPQVWNILKGEMSWIGPRPEAMTLSEWYEGEIPFYSYRHIVRPGITGWAQVNQGHVTDIEDVRAKLRFDFYYVKNLSLWLDILVALKTVRVIFAGIGAR